MNDELPSPSEAGFISQESASAFAFRVLRDVYNECRNNQRRCAGGVHVTSRMTPSMVAALLRYARDAGIQPPEDIK